MKITRSNITNTILRMYIKVLRAYVRAFKMYVKMLKMLKTFRAELQKLAMELGPFTDLSMHAIGFSKKLIVRIALGIKDRVLKIKDKVIKRRI